MSQTSAPKFNLNQPKAIFLGWTALVFVAGFGYFTVKANNTQKKREFMVKQAQEVAGTDAAQPAYAPANREKLHQSPLQSLTAAFTRQTDQRSRNQ